MGQDAFEHECMPTSVSHESFTNRCKIILLNWEWLLTFITFYHFPNWRTRKSRTGIHILDPFEGKTHTNINNDSYLNE